MNVSGSPCSARQLLMGRGQWWVCIYKCPNPAQGILGLAEGRPPRGAGVGVNQTHAIAHSSGCFVRSLHLICGYLLFFKSRVQTIEGIEDFRMHG